jgi:hypothetical protein
MSQLIRYAGDDYLTADAVADAVLEYAVALGDLGLMGVAQLPVWQGDGSVDQVRLVVGKDMPIATSSAPRAESDIDADSQAGASASRLRGTARSLRRRSLPVDAGYDEFVFFDEL